MWSATVICLKKKEGGREGGREVLFEGGEEGGREGGRGRTVGGPFDFGLSNGGSEALDYSSGNTAILLLMNVRYVSILPPSLPPCLPPSLPPPREWVSSFPSSPPSLPPSLHRDTHLLFLKMKHCLAELNKDVFGHWGGKEGVREGGRER